jgi:hypothetical protein
MNKIVREHYPVEKLPEDLRDAFPSDALVTVQVVQEDELVFGASPKPMSAKQLAELIRQRHEGKTDPGRSIEDIVAEVRTLRDEWDS